MNEEEIKSSSSSPDASPMSSTSSIIITEERAICRNTRSKRRIFDNGFLKCGYVEQAGEKEEEGVKNFLSAISLNPAVKRAKMEVNKEYSKVESENEPTVMFQTIKQNIQSFENKLEASPVIVERPKMEISGDRKLILDHTESTFGNLTSPGRDTTTDIDSNSEIASVSSTATTPISVTESTSSRIKRQRSKGKPNLHYRPDNGIVLNLDSYDSNTPILDQDDTIDNADVSFLHYALTYSRRMVVVTGAGISCASGIPDFRSSNGLFKSLKSSSNNNSQNTSGGSPGRELFTRSVYEDSEKTGEFHAMVNNLHAMSRDSEPSKFHHLMNNISSEGRLLRHYTQNVDCLESKLPHLQTQVPLPNSGPYPSTIQLHGSVNSMYCAKCHWESSYDPNLFTTDEAPQCPRCTDIERERSQKNLRGRSIGRLRPRIVLYEEFHPEGERIGKVSAQDLRAKPDCLLIVGTTLKIPGVKILVRELARVVSSKGGCVIWINKDQPTVDVVDYIEWIDLIVTGDCQVLDDVVQNYSRQLKFEGVKRGSKSKNFKEHDHTRTQEVQDIRDQKEKRKKGTTKSELTKENKDAELLTKKRMEKMNKEIKASRFKILEPIHSEIDVKNERLQFQVVKIPISSSDKNVENISECQENVFQSVFS